MAIINIKSKFGLKNKYLCTYTHIHTIYTHIHAYTYMSTYTYTCIQKYVHTYIKEREKRKGGWVGERQARFRERVQPITRHNNATSHRWAEENWVQISEICFPVTHSLIFTHPDHTAVSNLIILSLTHFLPSNLPSFLKQSGCLQQLC